MLGPPAVPIHPASCHFSCEELQDIDLELNVDNSAFYDQFAMAQVGGAAGQKGGVHRQAGGHSLLNVHRVHSPSPHPSRAGNTLVAKDGARQRR